jgi:glycosyltransferase involved in cell wall biosynthesis
MHASTELPHRSNGHPPRVLIVCETASMRRSGETAVPMYYFTRMLERGVDAQLVCHARSRDELTETFTSDQLRRVTFIEDSPAQAAAWKAFQHVPERVRALILGQAIHLSTQWRARQLAMDKARAKEIDVVLEPTPITPKGISCMFGLGVPVVVGPLCGGMEFPPAFRYMDPRWARYTVQAARGASNVAHRVLPGKLDADAIIVGNPRTERALPDGCKGKVYTVIESGVDLRLFQNVERPPRDPDAPVRFVYVARFVDWKGIEFVIDAFPRVVAQAPAHLDLVGDGELFQPLRARASQLGLDAHVTFHGRLPLEQTHAVTRGADVTLAPGLRECGGLAILEAMALGMPIVAVNWGGPGDYIDETCGIRVDPGSRQGFVDGLSEAMVRLANDDALRRRLGEGAVQRVRTNYFDWDSKTDRVLEILTETVERRSVTA